MNSGLGRLAVRCYDSRRLVLVAWIIGLIGVTLVAQAVKGDFQDKFASGNSQSQQAQNVLQQRFPAQSGDSADVVFHTTAPIIAAANRQTIGQLVNRLRPLANVTSVRSPFDAPAAQISRDGHIAFAVVQFNVQSYALPKASAQTVIDVSRSYDHPGFEVQLGGPPIGKAESASPGSSEAIGIFAAIIIMLIAFGSVVAMGLPIITALFGIVVGVGLVDLMSHTLVVPSFGTELVAMIGIGVGIDYALFIVTRYRQGLQEGRGPRDAVATAMATAGRAVLFAGCTVVISLLGLFVVNLPFMNGLAFGAIAGVLMVMAAALTLLPAILGFAGPAIDRLHVPFFAGSAQPGAQRGVWYRWSRFVQHRPWVAGTAALAALVVLILPIFSMRLAFTDSGNDPTSLTTRQAYDLLAQGFGPGFNGPLVIAVEASGSGQPSTVARLDSELHNTSGVAFVTPPRFSPDGTAAVIIAYPTTSPQAEQTATLVHHIRDQVVPAATSGTGVKVFVGGETAGGVDASAYLSSRLYWVIAVVIVLGFLLLMAVFRSLAVPLKAAVMNLLSIGAAYGVIVAVFQFGWMGSVIGIGNTGPIDPWIPLMMFTILFGLSMDYEVFLLSRIREEWRRTGDNATAVADGLASSARVITAAAAIMVCVFGSFVIGDLRILKVFGLGLAASIFIDASIVRMVLVPSVMEVLGPVNWWFPRWLDRVVPRLAVEVYVEAPVVSAAEQVAAAGREAARVR